MNKYKCDQCNNIKECDTKESPECCGEPMKKCDNDSNKTCSCNCC